MLYIKVNVRLLTIATAFTLLGGCTGLSPERYLSNKQDFMLSQGNPPAYVAGYIDGCSAGRRLAGDRTFLYRKNNSRFEKDALYARGWQEGQINCRNEALEESIRSSETGTGIATSVGSSSVTPCPPCEIPPETPVPTRAEEIEMRRIWEEIKK